MDPIAQILAQGQTRDEGATPQFQAYQAGVQQSLSRRNLDLQEARERRIAAEEAVLLPLKIAGQIQENKMRDITLAAQFQARQEMVEGAGALTEYGAKVSEALKKDSPNYPAILGEGLGLASKYPGLIPRLEPIFKNIEVSERYSTQRDIEKGRSADRAIQLLDKDNRTPQQKNAQAIIDAEARGDTRLADELRTQTMVAGETMESFSPDGSILSRFTRGGRGQANQSGVTPPNLTQGQAAIKDSLQMFRAAEHLKKAITPNTTGVVPTLKRYFGEGAAQIGEATGNAYLKGFVDTDSVVTAVQVAKFGSDIIKALKSDSQIAKDERNQLLAQAPGILYSSESNQAKLEAWQRIAADKMRANAEFIGVPIPPEALKPDEIQEKAAKEIVRRESLIRERAKREPTLAERQQIRQEIEEEAIAALERSPYMIRDKRK